MRMHTMRTWGVRGCYFVSGLVSRVAVPVPELPSVIAGAKDDFFSRIPPQTFE